MSFHKCSHYEPGGARIGDRFKCICSAVYVCVRRWPWRKWLLVQDDPLK